MVLPSSFFLLPLEIGALGYFCVLPVSKTSRELQGTSSELLRRDLGWEEKGSLVFPSGELSPMEQPWLCLQLRGCNPTGLCAPRKPQTQPLGVFVMHKPLSTTPAAAPGLSLPTRAHPSSFAGHSLSLACARRRGKRDPRKAELSGGGCALPWAP